MAHFQCNALGAAMVMKLVGGGGKDDAAGQGVECSSIATNSRSV